MLDSAFDFEIENLLLRLLKTCRLIVKELQSTGEQPTLDAFINCAWSSFRWMLVLLSETVRRGYEIKSCDGLVVVKLSSNHHR